MRYGYSRSMEVTSMTSKDIDDYLSFFEHNIIADQLPPKRAFSTEVIHNFFMLTIHFGSLAGMQEFARCFPMPPPSNPSRADPNGNATTNRDVDELITKLYRDSPAAASAEQADPPSVYRQYPIDASASLPEPIATLTQHLASLIGHTSTSLSATVIKLENLLQARILAQSQQDEVPAVVKTRQSRLAGKEDAMRRRLEAWEVEKKRRLELDHRDRGDRVRRKGTQMTQKSQAIIDDVLEDMIEQEIRQEMMEME